MKNRLLLVIILILSVGYLIVSAPLFAHHSFAWADDDHPITVEGTATQFIFSNPHSQVFFDVKDKDGNVEHWMLEIGPPASLRRNGWTGDSIKPGDLLVVHGGPAKDGRKIINVAAGTLTVNGQELNTKSK